MLVGQESGRDEVVDAGGEEQLQHRVPGPVRPTGHLVERPLGVRFHAQHVEADIVLARSP